MIPSSPRGGFSSNTGGASSAKVVKEPLKVVLRVRPFTTTEIATGSNISCISVDERNNIILRNPSTGACKQFQFSSVLSDKVSQKELFDTTISPFMTSFFSGIPSLILAYGVTAAGKTYTINGTNSQPGVIPRITDVILKTLNRHKPEKYKLAKVGLPGANIFQTLTHERMQQQQQQAFAKIPPGLLSSTASSSSSGSGGDLNYSCSDFSVSLASSTASSVFSDATLRNGAKDDAFADAGDEKIAEYEKLLDRDYDCTLFLSYLEIYNENVYDLLADTSASSTASSTSTTSAASSTSATNAGGKREGLTIAKDHIKGHTIVRGLRQVPITSYAEAQQAIELGFRNRSCADTALNRESSRSHAMLTFTLAQYPRGRDLQLLEHEASTLVRYSRLSVVDLAGSERLERTNNTGIQVTQASNINTSLLTFRLCVGKLRDNQRNPKFERPVPFRDSKLTRLFQDYLAGSGRAMMIVNVSPKAADYMETSHVIDFGCLAKAVTTTLRTGPASMASAKRRAGAGIGGEAWTSEKEEGYNKLLEQVKSLNEKLERIERDHLLAELDIRSEIADEYKAQIVSRDAMHHRNFVEQLTRIETLCESRLESMAMACEMAQNAAEAKIAEVTGELAKTRKDYEDALNEVSIERAKNTKESADFASSLQKIIAEYKEKNKTLLQEIEALKTNFQKTSAEEKAKIIAQCEADIKAVRDEVQAAAAKETQQLKAEMQREEKEHAEDRQSLLDKVSLLQEQLRTIQAKQTAEALTQSGRIIKKVLERSVRIDDDDDDDDENSDNDDDDDDDDDDSDENNEIEVERNNNYNEDNDDNNERYGDADDNVNDDDDEEEAEEMEEINNQRYAIKDDGKDDDYVYEEDTEGAGYNDDEEYESLSKSKRAKRRKETAKNNKKMFSKLLGQVSPKSKQKTKRSLSDSQESDREIRGLKTPVPLTASPLTPLPQTAQPAITNNDETDEHANYDDDDAIVEELPKKVVNVSRRRRRGKIDELKDLSMKQSVQQTPMKLRSGRRINK